MSIKFYLRLVYAIIFIPLMTVFLIQVLIGLGRWIANGYDFMTEEDPIFIIVAEKFFIDKNKI